MEFQDKLFKGRQIFNVFQGQGQILPGIKIFSQIPDIFYHLGMCFPGFRCFTLQSEFFLELVKGNNPVWPQLSGTILLTIMLWDLTLSHIEGAILFTLLIGYLVYLYWKKEAIESETPTGDLRRRDVPLLLLGMVMILGGSHFLVESAVDLAREFGISEWVIGATIVAAGTSAPEFATSLVAATRGRYGISVGNLIGSDIFNMFGVLGLAGIMRDLPVDSSARSNLIALSVMVLVVLIFMRTGWKISRKEGIVLVSAGLVRWVISFT